MICIGWMYPVANNAEINQSYEFAFYEAHSMACLDGVMVML